MSEQSQERIERLNARIDLAISDLMSARDDLRAGRRETTLYRLNEAARISSEVAYEVREHAEERR